MKKYEYKIETYDVSEIRERDKRFLLNQKVNKLSKNGWRLAQMDSIIADKLLKMGNSATTHFVLVFEREI